MNKRTTKVTIFPTINIIISVLFWRNSNPPSASPRSSRPTFSFEDYGYVCMTQKLMTFLQWLNGLNWMEQKGCSFPTPRKCNVMNLKFVQLCRLSMGSGTTFSSENFGNVPLSQCRKVINGTQGQDEIFGESIEFILNLPKGRRRRTLLLDLGCCLIKLFSNWEFGESF